MDSKEIDLIQEDKFKNSKLSDNEKKIALKILNELNGTLYIRAIQILKFCLKAIKYNKLHIHLKE